MMILVRQKTVKPDRKVLLKKNLILFENVDMIEPDQIRWDGIRYQRNNQKLPDAYEYLLSGAWQFVTVNR